MPSDRYSWTPASALWQAMHGEPGPRTDSAVAWLEENLTEDPR